MLTTNIPPTTLPIPPAPFPPPIDVPEPLKVPEDKPWMPFQEQKIKCPKCGVELDRITMYTCFIQGCPVFLQITC